MEYKNAYENLIEAVRKLLKANPSDEGIQNWAKDNVPQIFESEDEEIRKWIVDELKSSLHDIEALYSGDYDNRDKNDIIREDYLRKAIAFLEKQGEQDAITFNGAHIIDSAWSEEDEKGLSDALWAIQQARTIAKDENDMGNLWYAEHFLKSLKERVKLQPQQEWSEEDLICLGYLADFVDKNGDEFYGNNKPNVVKWIRSFANLTTPKQEWSEEDEEMYEEVLTDIIYAKNDLEAKECIGLSKRAMKAFNWFSKRYKFRPQKNTWKPSDQELGAILTAVGDERQKGSDVAKELLKIYQQLKKLKEG